MLVKIKKVLLDEQKVCINVPMNTQVHKIVADIFEYNYSKYFSKINMKIDLEDILVVSDSITSQYIDIPSSYLDKFTEISKKFNNSEDRILSIPCVNAYVFESKEYVEKIFENKNKPTLVILGFINNIPKEILTNILDIFGRTKLFMYGDELISSPEFGDYFNAILTNSEYSLCYSYSDYKNSIQKKINSLLNKLRDERSQTMSIIPSGLNTIKKKFADEIDMDELQEKLEEGSCVVVPRRILTQVNSKIKNMFSNSSRIELIFGDTCYTRFPFVTLKDDVPIVIPPLSKIIIGLSNEAETVVDDRRIILRNITVTKPNGARIDLNNVPIDFTGFLMQFDENEHIDNYDDFSEISEQEDPLYFSPSTMSVIPHKILTNIEQKYIQVPSLVVYLENLDLDPVHRNRSLWFQDMMSVTDELEVIAANRFGEI